ncbi:MAG: zonular occludens toxin domain-containing protein [Elusimicrobiota bacterium]|nr:hypothetical protein [Endomicrobiia bacterium]MDW8166166.1 zonular occludens toxin domain-containing protein [Elusimicrobiota bacterium]
MIGVRDLSECLKKYHDYYLNTLRVGFVIGIEGDRHMRSGCGKSYTAIRIAELHDEDFTTGINGIDKIVFRPREFVTAMEIIEEKKKIGQCIVIDEAGILVNAKKWYSFINRGISDAIMTFRQLRCIAIFVTPAISLIEKDIRIFLNHSGYTKKFFDTTDNKIKVFLNYYRSWYDFDQGKFMKRKLIFYDLTNHRLVRVDKFLVRHPQNLELIEEYEKRAWSYKSEIRKSISELEKIEADYDKIVMEILEKGELIVETKGRKKVYPEDIKAKYNLTMPMAKLVARRVNEKLDLIRREVKLKEESIKQESKKLKQELLEIERAKLEELRRALRKVVGIEEEKENV